MVVNNRLGYLFVFLGMSMALYAQRKTEAIRYGDLDQWVVRKITESAIIGKETKTLYCVGPTDTIIGNRPFESKASPWGSSNVMARVSGITKASVSVYPERRDEGYCARLETGIESISAMGIMNVKVLVGGCSAVFWNRRRILRRRGGRSFAVSRFTKNLRPCYSIIR